MRSWLARPALWRTLVSHVRLAARLVREPRVSMIPKAVLLLAATYVISPVDFVPDVLPILGQIDDLGIAMFALESFLRLCPAGAVAFHRDAIAARRRYSPMSGTDQIIDAQWRREE